MVSHQPTHSLPIPLLESGTSLAGWQYDGSPESSANGHC